MMAMPRWRPLPKRLSPRWRLLKALKYTTLIILDALTVCSSIPKASFCFHILRNFN